MKSLRFSIAVLLALMASVMSLRAEDVTVTVTTVQQVLPPQVMLYVTNPSDYFNITLSNTGKDDANVYLVMQVEQIAPKSELAVSTPATIQPKLPIIVPAGGSRQLAPAEIKGLFNHIPLSSISAPADLFNDYGDGSFALLPEGDYMVHLTAYRWDPNASTPFVVSAPDGGVAYFKICYQAQPPKFLTPVAGNGLDTETFEAAVLDPQLPQFTWESPVVACNPTAMRYNYDFRVVELMPGQMPDEVMDGQNVVYQATGLTMPNVTIPQTIVRTMNKDNVFAAQITAYPANSNSKLLNFVSIVNNGKSSFRLFRFKKDNVDKVDDGDKTDGDKTDGDKTDEDKKDDGDKDDDGKKDDGKKDDGGKDDDPDELNFFMGEVLHKDSLNNDSLYTFRVPRITEPYFFKADGARKKFVEGNIDVAWDAVSFMGGEGLQSDTIQFAYKVQLFNNGERADKEEAVEKGVLVYESDEVTDLKEEIEWEQIQEKVEAGDYMVLRILPVVKHGHSVAFSGDDNVIDFGLAKRASKQYFQCSDMVEIENKKPTTMEAGDLKGKEVGIGQYQLTIDEISGSAKDGFSGKGRVAWEPFGSKIMICVKFEKLRINTDAIVYEGECVSYAAPEVKSADFLEELFSDTGLDNIIADTGLPYADKLQDETDKKLKSLAEKYNIVDYYDEVTDGKNIYSLITTGEVDHVYLPVKLPSEVQNLSPVDIQIASMAFTPTHAQMNLVGETVLPKSDYLGNEILLFGAPRLCMSPTRFLPESGHLALLGNFTINDPGSAFAITFKAPDNVQEPKNGCYVSWHDDKFEDLGLDVDMVIPDLRKDKAGKATDECPKLHAQMRIGGWDDFIVDDVTMDPFQHVDLPGYTFTAKKIVIDLSDHRNSDTMGQFPEKYSRSDAGIKGQDELWHGLYIGEISVAFPKSLSVGEKEERLKLTGEQMFFDKSGCTLTFAADNILPPQTTGKLGGWGISLDRANLTIIQNDFENCHLHGRLDIPLFDKVEKSDEFGEVKYACDIRRLTDPRRDAQGNRVEQKMRYAYIFRTEQVDNLDFSCFVADVALDKRQTYFLLEAEDDEDINSDKLNTRVELCLGGNITIGGTDEINEKLGLVNEKIKPITDKLALDVKLPGIHFTKMRLSNIKRADWKSSDAKVQKIRAEREQAEQESQKGALALYASKEHELAEGCYLDLGEWSLASMQKKIGPFKFAINDYKFDFKKESGDVSLYVNGGLGLCDVVDVNAGITIGCKVQIPEKKTDLSGYSLSDGDVKFNDIGLKVEVAGAFTMDGTLKIVDEEDQKGYGGTLDIDITGLFGLKCKGGYYNHKADGSLQEAWDNASEKERETMTDLSTLKPEEQNYSWGYFMAAAESKTGIRIDPVVINRISGGFYFNCLPTAGADKENDKFGGEPKAQYGNIGIAFGLGLSTSAGDDVISVDADMLVVYDRKNKCLSTFMMNGKCEAIGGIIDAEMSLIYENQRDASNAVQNRYLCLNVTVESGLSADDYSEIYKTAENANNQLKEIKRELDEFQKELDGVYQAVTNPSSGLKQLSGDYEANPGGVAADGDDEDKAKDKTDVQKADFSMTAGRTSISLEFKITWVKDGKQLPTPKWHLYLGEPDKDKRCTFTYLKFNSSICTVDIGADGYVCIGNELPNNGALPEIPQKIQEFLTGHAQGGTSMGADMQKVERSRAKAAKALLDPTSLKGGVLVGASCWGDIDINLGLVYGSIESLAGFDASLIHYGNNAVCVNSRSSMGKNGWYALGQLYAYLAADLGIHIKIGHLIDEKVSLINAGIGGVLELGLPNPSWVEGQLRVKMSFLGGLAKVNKKFSFSAGDHCVPFMGNALDGFELFQNVSLGSDSLYEALYLPEFAISKEEAQKMVFTTNSSLGSHYRLVDPSYAKDIADETGEEAEKLSLHASRTYVFDMEKSQSTAMDGTKMGVRLIDLGTKPTELANGKTKLSPDEFIKQLGGEQVDIFTLIRRMLKGKMFDDFTQFAAFAFQNRSSTVAETSFKMKGKELTKGRDGLLNGSELTSYIENILDKGSYLDAMPNEKSVSYREDKGTVFHLTGMNLEPGHSYALVLSGDAYEIDNGKRVWCDYYSEADKKYHRIQWRQSKLWFFRVKSDAEDKIVGDSINDLTPYVALAYPSVDGIKVKSGSEGYTTAYHDDILKPTIALKRDLSEVLPESDNFNWKLTAYRANEYSEEHPNKYVSQQTRKAKYRTSGSCYNIEPETAFNTVSQFGTDASKAKSAGGKYDYSNELYHLQLLHTYYNVKAKKDSTAAIVDLWLTGAPHDVTIPGKTGTFTDNWLTTTSSGVTGKLLPYVEPFVGARPWNNPTIDYLSSERSLSDKEIVFDNSKTYDGKPYRLIDPYLYLAYLSKWVFIGDRAVSSYAWDDAEIPFGSESLIFEHNGTVINTEFLKGEESKSLYEFRNDMYNTWNDWHYNNPDLPEYPLPVTLGTVGGPTVVNQDNRASTITPLNVNHYDNQSYNITDLCEDFTAAYVVAQRMCKALKQQARELFDEFTWSLTDDGVDYDYLDRTLLDWNRLHRGEYLEVEYRGTKAKVPYYQLPLIFGDCFYKGKFDGIDLDNDKRGFSTTIGKSDITDDSRWPTDASNLLFFRLLGPEKFSNYTSQAFTRYKAGTNDNCYMYAAGTANEKLVAWDEFDIHKALKAVSKFSARLYRVDAYDTSTGLYTVNGSRGAGPWTEDVSIGASSSFAKTMDESYNQTMDYRQHLETHYDSPQPQAIYTSDDKTLTFVYSDYKYESGRKLNEKTISDVWSGDDFNAVGWQHLSVSQYSFASLNDYKYLPSRVETVTFDKSFAEVELHSTAGWFQHFSGLKKVNGLSNLNTSAVTDMRSMFINCMQLESIDLSKLDTRSVVKMGSMLASCENLTSIDISNWNTSKLEDVSYLFSGCRGLKSIKMSSFAALKATNTEGMFRNCTSLKTLKMEKFSPADVKSCQRMFDEVPSSVSVYYAYDLDDRIKDQIPGKKYEQNNPVKAIYATDAQSENVLLFINTLDTYKTGSTYTINNNRYKVNAIWSAANVLETGVTMPWNSYKSKITKVIVDASFKDSPKSLKNWFKDFTALKTVEGLENMNTKKVKDMSYMFNGCSKLKTADFSNFNTEQVTDMSYMFNGCSAMTDLDVSSFDTKQVEDLSYMFSSMSGLTKLKLGWFRTDNARTMEGMFSSCSKLQKIESQWWNLHATNATSLKQMFDGCEQLESLPLRISDTESVINMSYMFRGCKKLNKDLTGMANYFQLKNVTNLTGMFKNCSSVEKLDLVTFDTRNVTNMSEMFSGCSSLKELNLTNLSTPRMNKCTDMFKSVPKNCTIYIRSDVSSEIHPNQVKKATHPNLVLIYPAQVLKVKNGSEYNLVFLSSNNVYAKGGKWNGLDISEVWSGMDVIKSYKEYTPLNSETVREYSPGWVIRSYLGGDSEITKVIIDPSFAKVSPLTTSRWFKRMNNLTSIEGLEYLDVSRVESMAYMFEGCSSLKELPPLSKLNTSNVKDMEGLFRGCNGLTDVDLSGLNTRSVETMQGMFYACESLERVDLSSLDISSLCDVSTMFDHCPKLEKVVMPKTKSAPMKDMAYMFQDCASLKEIDLSCINLPNAESIQVDLFYGCTSLKKLTLGDTFNVRGASSSKDAFRSVCDMLVVSQAENLQMQHNDFVAYLGFVDGETGWFQGLEPETEQPKVAQAIWTESNSTLTFYYGPLRKTGGSFGGREVTKVWSGSFVDNCGTSGNYSAWGNSIRDKAIKVVFDASFASVKPKSCWRWFEAFTKLKSIEGLKYLDTSEATSMYAMFHNCRKLESIDVSGFNTEKVKNMFAMFENCASLTSLDLSSFDTRNVEKADEMFAADMALKRIKVGANCTFDGITKKEDYTFHNVSGLSVTVVPKSSTGAVKNAFVNKLGFKEGTHGEFTEIQAVWTAGNSTLTFMKGGWLNPGDKYNGQTVTNVWYEEDVLSTSGSANVLWRASGIREKVKTIVFDKSFAEVRPTSTMRWFYNFTNLTTIKNLSNLNTSEVTTMYSMFYNCSKLSSVSLSGFNTKKVTSMVYMFYGCSSLTSLDLSSFDTSSLTECQWMFGTCSKLTDLNLNKFNTSGITNANNMFNGCSGLKKLTVGTGCSFDKLSSASNVFKSVSGLYVLLARPTAMDNVKTAFTSKLGFKVGTHGRFVEPGTEAVQALWTEGNTTLTFLLDYQYKVGDMYNGQKVTKVWSGNDVMQSPENDVPEWDKLDAKVRDKVTTVVFDKTFASVMPTSMSYWFYYCKKLTTLSGMSNLNTSKVTNMKRLFGDCSSLTSITTSYFKTSNVEDMSYMFHNCEKLTSLNVSVFDTKKVKKMTSMFSGCTALTSLNISSSTFNTENVTDMYGMFEDCKGLTQLNLSKFNTSNVKRMDAMFSGASGLTTLDLSNFSIERVTTMSNMFSFCTGLKSVTIGATTGPWAEQLTTTEAMFEGCKKLQSVHAKALSGKSLQTTRKMFKDCAELSTLDFSISPRDDASYTFYNCAKLNYESLPVNINYATSISHMFDGCTSWKIMKFGMSGHSDDYKNLEDWSYAFRNCTSLKGIIVNQVFDTSNAKNCSNVFQGIKNDQILVEFRLAGTYEYKRETIKGYFRKLGFKEGITGHFEKEQY